jgi:hypothetical protein
MAIDQTWKEWNAYYLRKQTGIIINRSSHRDIFGPNHMIFQGVLQAKYVFPSAEARG